MKQLNTTPAPPERKPCPECDGEGCDWENDPWNPCSTCHGTGLMPTERQIQQEAWDEAEADRSALERALGL
jgi:DnaJ-class molecular chaperone